MVLLTKMNTPGETKINISGAQIQKQEFDRWGTQGGIGGFQFRREKREGRNPSSGSRTSRKYGISTTFTTTYPPITNTEKDPIY